MRRFAQIAVGLVWLYHGLWCKVLRGCAEQAGRERAFLWGRVLVLPAAEV